MRKIGKPYLYPRFPKVESYPNLNIGVRSGHHRPIYCKPKYESKNKGQVDAAAYLTYINVCL